MTHTLVVHFTVFTDDKDTAISEAERLLPSLLDGTDFQYFAVIDAIPDNND